VSSVNHGFNPEVFLDGIPSDRVRQIHLAGFSDRGTHLLDTHDHPVSKEVWQLYEKAVRKWGAVPTMVEWDSNIPEYEVLEAESLKALEIQKQVLFNHSLTRRPDHDLVVAKPSA
jgi:uncharacterized protein (UPF0276 family)